MTHSESAHRLSALEAAFLGIESRDVPFVHAGILCFDRPIELEPLRAHVDSALAALPRYRQRIERHLRGTADWVPDLDYDIARQIQVATVAAPGGPRELDELAAHLLATELPVDHAPWRLWTVQGLADGRGAVISVFHHSLIDGIAGFRLIEHVLGAHAPAAPTTARRAPRPGALGSIRRLVAWRNLAALARLLRDGLRPASQIGLNPRHTGPARVVASHTVEIAAIQEISRAFHATNNDVVLASVTGALRRTLERRGIDPDTLRDVRAMVPVGRHPREGAAPVGNHVVLLLAALPVDERDPVAGLRRITATTHALKTGHTVAGGDLLMAVCEATTPTLLVGVMKVALWMRGFNLIVTNVPGPTRPLTLLGARLTRIVPVVNLWPHQALGIAAASYADTMTFGMQGDRDVIPDVDRFRDDLAAAFDALRDAATRKPSAAAPASDELGQVRAMHRAEP